MKRATLYGLVICLFNFGVTTSLKAQEVKKRDNNVPKVVEKTIMEQYEPNLILTAEDRAQLKRERLEMIQKRSSIIDTLNISERRKRRLLKELYRTPHSYKWDKLLADLQFADDDGY